MEIIDYLRILRRRVLVLILVPVIAVGIAVAWALLKPPLYTGVATVNGNAFIGTTTSQFSGPQGVSQFVGAYAAAASGPQVLNVVSDQLDVPVRDLRSDLSVTQVGASATMRVSYSSGDRDTVEPVLNAVVRETFSALFQPRLEQSTRDLATAQQGVKEANAAAKALADQQKVADPRQAYSLALGRMSNLQQQQATLRANGNSVAAAALDSAIRAAKAAADAYAPLLEEYENVQAQQNAANDALASAQQEARLAEGQMASTQSSRVVYLSGVSSAAATNDAWALVLPVLGAALFTALVLVFVLELLSRAGLHQRKGKDGREEGDAELLTTPGAPAPVTQGEGGALAPAVPATTASTAPAAGSPAPPEPDDAAEEPIQSGTVTAEVPPEATGEDATEEGGERSADAGELAAVDTPDDVPDASEADDPEPDSNGTRPEGTTSEAEGQQAVEPADDDVAAPAGPDDDGRGDPVPVAAATGTGDSGGLNGSTAPRKGPRRRTRSGRTPRPR